MGSPRESSIPCPGACCKRVHFNHVRAEIVAGAAFGNADLTRMLEVFELDETATTELNGARREAHRCRVFDGHRCTQYERRPRVCRLFPDERGCPLCTAGEEEIPRMRAPEEILRRSGRQQQLETGCFDPHIVEVLTEY